MPLVLDPAANAGQAQSQRDYLAKSLYRVLVAAGVLNTDGVVTGPHLLMAADDYAREHGIEEGVDEVHGSYGVPKV